jgi:hypothetical protein
LTAPALVANVLLAMAIAKPTNRRNRARGAAVSDDDLREITWMLERRGLTFVEANASDRLVLPDDRTPEEEVAFYQEMKRYSSRILLRDLIHHPEGRQLQDLTRFAAADAAQELVLRLGKLRAIEQAADGRWRLCKMRGAGPGDRPLHSFGDTLEWFVAQVFRQELHAPAAWGVVVRGNAVGGDLDVVALVERYFVLAEVKSSPPKHVDIEVVRKFVERVASLRPHAALFVEDTELRMADKIIPLFGDVLAERAGRRSTPISRLEHELFLVGSGIYVVNSRADLTANLRQCVAHFLRRQGLGDLGIG